MFKIYFINVISITNKHGPYLPLMFTHSLFKLKNKGKRKLLYKSRTMGANINLTTDYVRVLYSILDLILNTANKPFKGRKKTGRIILKF